MLIVEGENAAEGARDHVDGYVIMTWPGGTSAVAYIDLTPLKGRDIMSTDRRTRGFKAPELPVKKPAPA